MKIIIIIAIIAIIGAIVGYIGADKDSKGDAALGGAITAGGGCLAVILSLMMWLVPIVLGIAFIGWLLS